MITFLAVKQFGRIDYRPKTPLAQALAALKGCALNQKDVDLLQSAGMELTILTNDM